VKVHVFMTPHEVDSSLIQESAVVVIDVVRATTSMVEALANGARAIYPTASAEDAVRLAASLGREDTLLCGERKGIKVEGFDLGNSPGEFTPEMVEGKRLVMSTTNGTVALGRVAEATRVLAGALTNLAALAEAVRNEASLVVLCAGRGGRFALDDALCAGHLVRRLGGCADLNDGGRAVWELAGTVAPGRDFLAGTESGRALGPIGLAGDLDVCGQVDRHSVVPEVRDQALVLC
jgi:2-phosphosulfolactate phosphatase